jgi:hypothetical protein
LGGDVIAIAIDPNRQSVKANFHHIMRTPGEPRCDSMGGARGGLDGVRHPAITSAANLVVSRGSMPRLFIFDDLNGLFLAPRAFKSAQIVFWLIGGLYTGEPHLSATRFAKRQAH